MDVSTLYLKAEDLNALGDSLILCTVGYPSDSTLQVEVTDTATGVKTLHSVSSDGAGLITWDTTEIDFMDHTYQFKVLKTGEEISMNWDYDEDEEDYDYTSQVVQIRFKYFRNSDHELVRAGTQEVIIEAV